MAFTRIASDVPSLSTSCFISVASVLKYREYTQDSHQWQMQLLLEQLASQVSHKTIKVIFNQQITESGSLPTAASSCDFFLIPAPEGNRKVYYWSVLLLEADTGTLPALSRHRILVYVSTLVVTKRFSRKSVQEPRDIESENSVGYWKSISDALELCEGAVFVSYCICCYAW